MTEDNNKDVNKESSKIVEPVDYRTQDLKYDDVPKRKIKKVNTTFRRTQMSNFGLFFSKLYQPLSIQKIMLITIAMAIFFGALSVFFVKNVGIYNFGLAAIGQSVAKIVAVNTTELPHFISNLIDQIIFWLAYIILSIPIFIFGYKKIGKFFIFVTVVFLLVSSMVSIGIGLIPGANDVFIIGDFSNPVVKEALPENQKHLSSIIPLMWSDGGNIAALLVYATFYGVVLAFIFAIIQIIGGTAGVTGIIGEWYANVKQKSFGTISGYMNIIIVIFSVLVGSWLPGSILLQNAKQNFLTTNNIDTAFIPKEMAAVFNKAWNFELYLSPNFVATVFINVLYIVVLNKIYPKFKLVRLEIYSPLWEEIQNKIKNDRKIVAGSTVFRARGGYKGKKINVLVSVILFRHVLRIIHDVRKIDKDAFISISNVRSIDGWIYLPDKNF